MVTNDAQLARTARMMAQHGQSGKKHEHQIEGRNSRMDGLQAAILSAKLPHLRAWTEARRAVAERYRAKLAGVVNGLQRCPEDSASAWHLFVVETETREAVQATLAERQVATAIHYPRPLPCSPRTYGSAIARRISPSHRR